MSDQPFSGWDGMVAARKLFGAESNGMLDELSEALVRDTTAVDAYTHNHFVCIGARNEDHHQHR
jgi:hypothetical protein